MKHEKSHFDLYVMKAAMLGTRVKGVNVRLNQNMILRPIQSEDTGCFLHWASPKKLKYGKPRLGESTLT